MTTDQELIEARCKQEGLTITGWAETDDGETALLGRYLVSTPDYDADGLYEGDEGVLSACVVGSTQYGNRGVSFSFTPEGYDGGVDVSDLWALDRVED